MSTPIRDPQIITGSPRSSGDVQTGEIPFTRGGGRVYTQFSGLIGGDALVYSGGGRLNSLLIINPGVTSGAQTLFYDGAVATSGGPFVASGHKILATIPNLFNAAANSGYYNPYASPGLPLAIDMPFQSGLCVAVFKSGGAGFSVSYTPESNILDAGGSVGG